MVRHDSRKTGSMLVLKLLLLKILVSKVSLSGGMDVHTYALDGGVFGVELTMGGHVGDLRMKNLRARDHEEENLKRGF